MNLAKLLTAPSMVPGELSVPDRLWGRLASPGAQLGGPGHLPLIPHVSLCMACLCAGPWSHLGQFLHWLSSLQQVPKLTERVYTFVC